MTTPGTRSTRTSPTSLVATTSPRVAPKPAEATAKRRGRRLHRLGNGQVLRVDGFRIEEGEILFRRLGGMVGVALNDVARLLPEPMRPVIGRTPVRYAQELGPDFLEVRGRSGAQRVRLIGLEPVAGTRVAESSWNTLFRGLVVYLEFDRQRYDKDGSWDARGWQRDHLGRAPPT